MSKSKLVTLTLGEFRGCKLILGSNIYPGQSKMVVKQRLKDTGELLIRMLQFAMQGEHAIRDAAREAAEDMAREIDDQIAQVAKENQDG